MLCNGLKRSGEPCNLPFDINPPESEFVNSWSVPSSPHYSSSPGVNLWSTYPIPRTLTGEKGDILHLTFVKHIITMKALYNMAWIAVLLVMLVRSFPSRTWELRRDSAKRLSTEGASLARQSPRRNSQVKGLSSRTPLESQTQVDT